MKEVAEMIIDSIKNGIVIDHITAGKGMELYNILKLGERDCAVALLQNVVSSKFGRKDIIKVDANIDLDLDAIGYVDPNATVNVITDGKLVEKKDIGLPEKLQTAKEDLIIMHPLPRVNEISVAVDNDPRACYFKQALYGKFMREALILKLLEVQ